MKTNHFLRGLILSTLLCLVVTGRLSAQPYPKTPRVDFRYSGTAVTKTLYVRSNPAEVCTTIVPKPILRKAVLYAVANWKGDYSNTPAQYTVKLTINVYSGYTGTGGLLATYTPDLVIDANTPQSYVAIDFTGLHATAN